jgi:hypothetical protein
LRRGHDKKGSGSVSAKSGLSQHDAIVVQHQGSLLNDVDGAGACGNRWPCEQDRPEHGRSRRGLDGAKSFGSTVEWPSHSRSESDSWTDRLRFEVTP